MFGSSVEKQNKHLKLSFLSTDQVERWLDANVIVMSGTCTYTSLVKGSQATAFLASLSVQVVQHFLGFMSLGYVFLNGAPPPAWRLQVCLREVNFMEISINSSILNIFEPQLSTKRFFNNNGKKRIDQVIISYRQVLYIFGFSPIPRFEISHQKRVLCWLQFRKQ